MNSPELSNTPAYWVIVPAAGVGSRMGAGCPKQYLPLLDKTVLEHTLERLLAIAQVKKVFISLSAADDFWNQLPCGQDANIIRVAGGSERANSVLNALQALSLQARDSDWVLVHDAARPCIRAQEIMKLIDRVGDHPVGGILGVPVSDTLKQVSSHVIEKTIDRAPLWQAQTPQLFRIGLLRDCLQRALAEGKMITDEASAVEAYDYHPLMVQGRSDNIKITRQEDLAIAAMLMQQQVNIG
ncbi:2-C-methyl-D-erythritol 4-phosphate cytidylyltransferase [Cellvibrio sp. KY-GH-1]|uniref:2-C-methyl-D-erythritol 4-phosphate cytidylyltransferase n=1 Tax=Cellvibrio sp. KY-GH-1 TaxID=2303332 RepID=UPI0012469F8D|nr:2-C-methyl-D-erythritol 4-phosphate cytidylyltransferase [Cellvibrio sp. KY-GH-1]QEY15749.1 2-C-methyl-D-erythritol 4-phosphate cytidylyltransferase [Cellvibrio sp. KY-GH-1]